MIFKDKSNGFEDSSINHQFGWNLEKLTTSIKPKPVSGKGKLFRLADEDKELKYAVSAYNCDSSYNPGTSAGKRKYGEND